MTLTACIAMVAVAATPVGDFDAASDVGALELPGSVVHDAAAGTYRVTASGENMWYGKDAYYFVWKKMTGDVTLTADVKLLGEGTNAHRKAGLIVRQSLEEDAPYVDVVIHGNGLTSLQYRTVAGADTSEVQASVNGPARLRLQRAGDVFSFDVALAGTDFEPAGAVSIPLKDPVYVGLAVCSHDTNQTETAVFSNVAVESYGVAELEERVVESTLEIINIETSRRRTVYRARDHFEAPNWSRDGNYLLFNQEGAIYSIPVGGGTPAQLDTGFATRCNNDHGLSPDGSQLVISHRADGGSSQIYVLPSTGGTPRQVTPKGPSYWHGWSPDGKTLAYCAERDGEYDVYTIPVEGGEESRLTDTPGLDDGPDYSRDGKYIYFNSTRSGLMKIWRMGADGGNQEQLTSDEEYADWFAHPSADGQWLVFMSYDKSVNGHPPNKDVALRLMPAEGGAPRVIARLFGGQGTINVPSWSPDSKEVAFVSYRLVTP